MKNPSVCTENNTSRIIKTFIKNYDYGTWIGILTCSQDADYKKAYLQYYKVLPNGVTKQEITFSKETSDLEKLARNFINKQNKYILWSY